MINPEEQVGKVAQADGKFYTPKYWVAKFKTDSDVLLSTASKNLHVCQEHADNLYPDAVENDDLVFILVEVKNVHS